ncbi:hypothetical protein AYL99_06562 [Fonsecaea erecta]|uniref:Transcription factor domain-containing protein n=1 Tax=Fonsecaea erecta TaxID=1367422 RepID=A0A178ZHI0_9EURO|nr:hypothetical protein AYL99_06562 [Fonsecaea erecta]OAP59264.1 hypothetical protein AYL99_06562 [Fonsecaea erecta]
MQLILAFSSYAWANFNGGDKHYERKGLTHMIQGMTLVIKNLAQTQSSTSEGTIQATMILSAIEAQAGNIEGFKTHLSAARLMVKMRGGLDQISSLLRWQICLSEPGIYQTIGVETFPCTDRYFGFFLLHCRPDVAMRHAVFSKRSPSAKLPVEEVLEFRDPLDLPPSLYFSACITEFLLVTGQFRELSSARNRHLTDQCGQFSALYASAKCTSVSNALHPKLRSILNPDRSPTESCSAKKNATSAGLEMHDAMGMVCLFYIHATLWRYRHEPAETDRYMQRLVQDVERNSLQSSQTLSALNRLLVWLCLTDENLKTDDGEMGWRGLTRLVSRLTRVASRLSEQSRKNLELAMFEGLGGKQQSSMAGEVDHVGPPRATAEDCRWPNPEKVWKGLIGSSWPSSQKLGKVNCNCA